MKLAGIGGPHLTYCTNIHPGESWAEVRANLERHVRAVRRRVAPDTRFGVGLRLSARAAEELAAPAELAALRAFLAAEDLYVFTLNGFPYGRFHGAAIKEDVYRPDWLEDARLTYTERLAALLAALLPDDDDLEGSISTVPGAFKARVRGNADVDAMIERLLRSVAALHAIGERTGRVIALALEPEPCCHLETVAETVAFFARLRARPALERLGQLTGLGRAASAHCLERLLGVCLDACHLAVEYEEPAGALEEFAAAGIRIVKVQISAGLEVAFDGRDDGARLAALHAFAEDVYLHQVVERSAAGLRRYLDLPAALAAAAADAAPAPRTWRIHFHVPLFREELGPFRSTQPWVRALLGHLGRVSPAPHLEVETYTWDVLPAEYRREDVVEAVARELTWARTALATAPGAGASP